MNRIVNIYKKFLFYESKREFSTKLDNKINNIKQLGDIEQYARKILKMVWAGTNRQITGIYAKANETINIFIKAQKTTDPLPKIYFSQYIGNYSNWLSTPKNLKIGKNIFTADDFKISDDYKIPTSPGGPIYLSNPYNSSQQGQIDIYIEGGVVFPTFRKDENETEYKVNLEKWVNLVKKLDKVYPDITEFYSDRLLLTVRATDAYNIYSQKNGITPDSTLFIWDTFLKFLYTFDGIQFSTTEPYYDIKNFYVNVHIRYSQPYGAGYAFIEHVGIFSQDWIDRSLNFTLKTIGWGFPHEIGHMMDIPERTITDYTNNMISKYYYFVLLHNPDEFIAGSMKNKIEYLTRDNIDNKLRGCDKQNQLECKGFLFNTAFNYYIFWDLESYLPGYWAKIENMYRYQNTLPSGITKEEKFVYFSSIILKIDLGYYFTRWDYHLIVEKHFLMKKVHLVYIMI